MRVHVHAGPSHFLAAAEQLLLSDPFSTNVIAVVASRIMASREPANSGHLWASVEDTEGQVVGVAMHTLPHHLFVSRMPREAAAALAHDLADAGRDLPGVNGAVGSTEAFAEAWTARTGRASEVVTAMRVYRLGILAPPRSMLGEAAVAMSDRDIDIVAEWLGAFHDEAQPDAPVMDWRALAELRVSAGEVYLWRDNDTFVALAAVSAPAVGVARVGPVYTLPRYRRRGYGAAVTAKATAAALGAGAQHVILYTDLANPTSNSIYQAIGYRPDHDAQERAFT